MSQGAAAASADMARDAGCPSNTTLGEDRAKGQSVHPNQQHIASQLHAAHPKLSKRSRRTASALQHGSNELSSLGTRAPGMSATGGLSATETDGASFSGLGPEGRWARGQAGSAIKSGQIT